MKKNIIFYIAAFFTIAGLGFIGLGIGLIFNQLLSGSIIGFGTGLAITALVLFNILRRMDAFEKK